MLLVSSTRDKEEMFNLSGMAISMTLPTVVIVFTTIVSLMACLVTVRFQALIN